MADFILSVGATPDQSWEQFKQDITKMINGLNNSLPTVKVKLEVNQAFVDDIKAQITNIQGSIGENQVSSPVVDVSNLIPNMASIESSTNSASEAIGSVASGMEGATAATQNFKMSTEESLVALSKIKELIASTKKAQKNWTAAASGESRLAYENLGTQITELNNLHQAVLRGDLSPEQFNSKFATIFNSIRGARAEIKGANEDTKSWSHRIGGLAEKFSTWFSITRVIMAAVRTIKQMYNAVVEVDTAMTELRKVTDETNESYNNFLDRAASKAEKLGSSISDYINAASDYARLGHSLAESEMLADVSVIYSNVGDNINIDQANEAIVSTMKGFGLQAKDAQSIVDKFNEIGNNFAIGTDGIGEALKRSSAALHAANNTLDESIGLATAMNTVLQDPEKVGTTLKTVSMFLRASKVDAELAGISIEGMANSTSKLRADILALTDNKVDIMLDEQTYKSTYQVLEEIAKEWKNIEDIDRSALLELLGGKRNANAIAAVLENFDIAKEALQKSQDSTGSALIENEKYLDSIAGKTEQLSALFQELSINFLDSKSIKDLIDLSSELLQILNIVVNLTNSIGGLNTIIKATISLVAVRKANQWLSWMDPKPIKQANKELQVFGKNITSAHVAMMGLTLMLDAVMWALDNLTVEAELEAWTESVQEVANTISEIENLNNELDSTDNRIKELLSQDSLSFVEEEELIRLQQINAELEAQLANKNALAESGKKDVIDDFMTIAKAYNPAGTNYKLNSKGWSGIFGDVIFGDETQFRTSKEALNSMNSEELEDAYDDYQHVYEEYTKIMDALKDGGIKLQDLPKEGQFYFLSMKDYMWDIALAYADSYGGLENVYSMIYNDEIFQLTRDAIDKLVEEGKFNEESLKELLVNSTSFKALLNSLDIDTTKDNWARSFIDWFNADNTTENIETAAEVTEEFATKLKEIQNAYNSVKSVIDDYNDNGKISVDNYMKLLEIEPQYLALLVDENGQLNLNAEAYDKVVQAKIQELTISRVKALFDSILGMKKEEAQAYANADAYNTETDSLLNLVKAEYEAALIRAKTMDAETGDTTYSDALKRSIQSVASILNTYSSVSDKANDSTKNFTDSLKEQKDALSKQKDELEEAKDSIQSLIDLTIDMIKKEKELEKEGYEEQKEHLNELIEKRKEILQAKKDEAEFDKELADKQNTVAQNALAAAAAELDNSSAGRKAQKETQDKLNESRSDLYDTLDDHNYDELINALDKEQKLNEEYYGSRIETVDKYLSNERKIYEDATALIDENSKELYENLDRYVYNHTTMTKAEFQHMWEEAQTALAKYDDAHTPLFTTMSLLDGQIYYLDQSIGILETNINNLNTNTASSMQTTITNLEKIKDLYDELKEVDADAVNISPAVVGVIKGVHGLSSFVSGKHASGTTSAPGGLSLVGENGAELRVLNKGDGILPSHITKNLWALGSNPQGVLSQVATSLLNGFSNVDIISQILHRYKPNMGNSILTTNTGSPAISISMPITIQGNADANTIRMLEAKSQEIADMAATKVMKSALQISSVPRRY